MTQIEKQVSYLRKRITELVSLCQKDSSPTVSDDVLNTAQDIISRLRRLLDNIMSEYYINRIKPHLSVQDAKASKPTFPICDKVEDIKGQLGKFNAADLETISPEVYKIIEKAQPYHTSNKWIKYLRDYYNLGHWRLVAQEKKRDISLVLGDVIRISDRASVTMNNCLVNGVPVDYLRVDKGAISGRLDARLNPRVEIKVLYLLEGENVDVLWLCQKSLTEIELILKSFAEKARL
ncbi:TPA: hypothetical protein DEB72_01395 [Patescibacteria group bacterium]|nr:hypothetical protein [Patescibacteria group bacterium]